MRREIENWFHQHKDRMERMLTENEKLEELINESIKSTPEFNKLLEASQSTIEWDKIFYADKQAQEYADLGILYSVKNEEQKLEIQKLITPLLEHEGKSYLLFTVDDLDVENDWVEGLFLSKKKQLVTTSKIPKNIYNLALLSKPSSVKAMRQLRTKSTINVINPINWFYQDILFDMLAALPNSNDFILPYSPFGKERFKALLAEFKHLFLIKRRDYLHPEIIQVYKESDNQVKILFGQEEKLVLEDQAFFMIEKVFRNQKYNIYKGIDSITRNRLPLECRVYAQKGKRATWEITSKVVKHEMFSVGSIYHGETEAFNKSNLQDLQVEENLNALTIQLATYLDYFLPNVGSYYFDFIIGENENVYLLYIGGVEQFHYLARSNQQLDWNLYLQNIIEYLTYFSKENTQVRLDEDEEDMD